MDLDEIIRPTLILEVRQLDRVDGHVEIFS